MSEASQCGPLGRARPGYHHQLILQLRWSDLDGRRCDAADISVHKIVQIAGPCVSLIGTPCEAGVGDTGYGDTASYEDIASAVCCHVVSDTVYDVIHSVPLREGLLREGGGGAAERKSDGEQRPGNAPRDRS